MPSDAAESDADAAEARSAAMRTVEVDALELVAALARVPGRGASVLDLATGEVHHAPGDRDPEEDSPRYVDPLRYVVVRPWSRRELAAFWASAEVTVEGPRRGLWLVLSTLDEAARERVVEASARIGARWLKARGLALSMARHPRSWRALASPSQPPSTRPTLAGRASS